jgi:hypothetical protein
MPPAVIVLSTDKIRGAILYKAFEKDRYRPVLLNSIVNFKSSVLLNPRAVVVLDAGTFYLSELKDFNSISAFLEPGFLIVIDALEENKNAALQGIGSVGAGGVGIGAVRFPHLPIDPEAVIHKTGEILSALVGPPSDGAPSVGTPSAGTPSVGTPSVGAPSVGAPSVGAQSVGAQSVGVASADALLAAVVAPVNDTRPLDSILEDLKRFLNLR